MPKFYFHFAAAGVFADDRVGKELADLAAAHSYAVWLIQQATSYFDQSCDWSDWTVRVCTPRRRLLLALMFRSCVKGSVNRSAASIQRATDCYTPTSHCQRLLLLGLELSSASGSEEMGRGRRDR